MNQERTARRTRRAAAQAEAIIEEAVRRVRCRECGGKGTRAEGQPSKISHGKACSRYVAPAQPTKAAQKPAASRKAPQATPPRPSAPQAGTVDLAAECKRLRDEQGMAWWRIGWELKLPGSADNVAQGKSGAAQARRLYAQANGGVPHVPQTRTARERAERMPRHAANSGTKTDRKIQLVEKGHVIPTDMPDEEVLATIAGKVIEWGINVSRLAGDSDDSHWLNQEARVHPVDLVMEEDLDKYGSRVIRFREYLGLDDHGNHMSGPTRTVRVNSIHTVR